ncbi:MAG TPA: glycosyltransferase [Rectinemataceae bacterium]|nr:glycosyltransferase [Rectinemataceae bacterium]
MNLEIEFILLGVILLVWLDLIIILRTLFNKSKLALSDERRQREIAGLTHLFETDTKWDKKKVGRLFDNYLRLKQSILLPEHEHLRILNLAKSERLEAVLKRRIRYRSRYERMEASLGLALIRNEDARRTLEQALVDEKDFPVKLFIANALAEIKDPRSLSALVQSLIGAHRWYRDKVNLLIASFGPEAFEYLRGYFWREESEIIELFLDISLSYTAEELKEYLIATLSGGRAEIERLSTLAECCVDKSCFYCRYGQTVVDDTRRHCRYKGRVSPDFCCRRYSLLVTSQNPAGNCHRLMLKAAECIEKYYGDILDSTEFLEYGDKDVRAIAVRSLGSGNRMESLEKLLRYLGDEQTLLSAKIGLSRILVAHPRFIPAVAQAFNETADEGMRKSLAEILAGRIEYFITKLSGKEKDSSARLIREIIGLGKVSEIIEFLKLNKDEELEEAVIGILREAASGNERLKAECGLYLPDRLVEKCGFLKIVPPARKREEKRDWKMVRNLYAIIVFALLFFPALYALRHGDQIRSVPPLVQIKTYLVDFNYNFAWYSMSVNAIYIVLLLLSVVKVKSSTRLWNLKTMSFLFKPRILPSVSIIAPAFNEEKTILESANSLLNLKYPDYQLVIVNDGSRDDTLNTLISHYNLKRTDHYYEQRLKTASVRGIYMSPLYPRLVVVDKENGGKADSLNAGINIASKEYFCGIDADSLLEPDSLLKVAALTLDYGVETPAMGGNVFPINGCGVDRGKLTHIALPSNNLAKLQTIEYLRAFMCGRLGWAQINSLLIISGAFGLFRKERVISIGGYLTSNERYGKDTVGEDMELVVRIARLMREKKQKYRISYAYNANCWTEVPETMNVLKRQRDRWHRGLIDIMYFHRKLLFNPAYGKMGLLGMPYFLIFEMVGPLFEIQGYLMVGLAALFGLISAKLAILLFISTIFMGILISMASVLIAERQIYYFNYADTLKMLAVAFIENFGPRQLFSMWRVFGFFSAMKKPKGWGKMERKGFSSSAAPQGKAGSQPGKDKK